jgi:hypothetical protein
MDANRSTVEIGESLAQHAHRLGFRPAFLDIATFSIHLSRYADGRPAPVHLLEGLPDEAVVTRKIFATSRVVAAKPTLVPGYERNGFFYTTSAAARAAAEWPCGEETPATDAIADGARKEPT